MSSREVSSWCATLLEVAGNHPLGLAGDLPCEYGAAVGRTGLTGMSLLVMRWRQAAGCSWCCFWALKGEAAITEEWGWSSRMDCLPKKFSQPRGRLWRGCPHPGTWHQRSHLCFGIQGARKWAKETVPSTVKAKHVPSHVSDKPTSDLRFKHVIDGVFFSQKIWKRCTSQSLCSETFRQHRAAAHWNPWASPRTSAHLRKMRGPEACSDQN